MPRSEGDSPILTDGTTSFAGGVDSIKVTTVASALNPKGLRRDQLAWLINGTVRDGGISPRWGWQPLFQISDGSTRYQRGFMYEPSGATPYLVLQMGGRIYRVDPVSATVTDLSSVSGLTNPATTDMAYFCQGEEFLVIQAGDYSTLPLFWDGATLSRSLGLGGGELPAAGPMDYYMNRIWYAQDRLYTAGDIVGGGSGTPAYNQRDSILHVTENPLALGGDGFTVPDSSGNIRALAHAGNLNSALGEGVLYIFTHKAVYALTVPVTRTDWIAATNNNQPLQTVVQLVNGAVNDGSVVPVNGDLYFQSFEPGIRSLVAAIRYFQQPGNIQISANEDRLIQFNDRSLLKYASGIEFDNRLLETALPFDAPCGTAHRAIAPLDFVPVSSFNEVYSPVWEGNYEGLDILQLFQGDFGGLQRAFAVVFSRRDNGLYLWELVRGGKFENGDQRITMQIEFPAFEWGKITQQKRLVGGELWIDRLYGTVEFTLEYRVDGETCWIPWHKWKDCAPRNTNEHVPPALSAYPASCGSGYRQTIDFPRPPTRCSLMIRPSDIGYQFQVRLTVHGYCRVRGLFLHATMYEKRLYQGLPC